MKNSTRFKLKVKTNKYVCIVFTLLIIFLFVKYLINNLIGFSSHIFVVGVYSLIVLFTIVCMATYLVKLNKLLENDNDKFLDELDNKLDKTYGKYGLYITENYIVCIGKWYSLFNIFVVEVKDIDAVDTHGDHRYLYKKKVKGEKVILYFFKSIIDRIVIGGKDRLVFNIICNKDVYRITSTTSANKTKVKEIDKMADYICDKNEDIDCI